MSRKLLSPLVCVKLTVLVLCLVLAEALYRFAPLPLIGVISKTVPVFVGTVWVAVMAFALKVAEVTDIPGLTVAEHERLEQKARAGIRHIWLRAASNVLSAVLVMLPSVFLDGKVGAVWHWMVLGAGIAVAWSVISIIDQARWQEDFRRLKSQIKLRERKELAHKTSVDAMKPSTSDEDAAATHEEIAKHNKKGEWSAAPEGHSTSHYRARPGPDNSFMAERS